MLCYDVAHATVAWIRLLDSRGTWRRCQGYHLSPPSMHAAMCVCGLQWEKHNFQDRPTVGRVPERTHSYGYILSGWKGLHRLRSKYQSVDMERLGDCLPITFRSSSARRPGSVAIVLVERVRPAMGCRGERGALYEQCGDPRAFDTRVVLRRCFEDLIVGQGDKSKCSDCHFGELDITSTGGNVEYLPRAKTCGERPRVEAPSGQTEKRYRLQWALTGSRRRREGT